MAASAGRLPCTAIILRSYLPCLNGSWFPSQAYGEVEYAFAPSPRVTETALMEAIQDPLLERYELIQAMPTDKDRREWVDALLALPAGRLQGSPSPKTKSPLSKAPEASRTSQGLATTALGLVADWVFDVIGWAAYRC
jgi:hypothetical protein